MKPIYILFLLFTSLTVLDAQQKTPTDSIATYPLQVGNVWQYYTYDYLNGVYTWVYGWTEKITSDSTLPNGARYYKVATDRKFRTEYFIRQKDNSVFYLSKSGRDSLVYDFSKKVGDTIFISIGGYKNYDTSYWKIIQMFNSNIYGQKVKTWVYFYGENRSSYYLIKELTGNFGITTERSEPGNEWFLRGAIINGVKYGTITSVEDDHPDLQPKSFELFPNYPNPFNASTTISFYIQTEQNINISIYDLLGRKVASLLHNRVPSGMHKIYWDGKNDQGSEQSSGVYFFRMQSEAGFKQMKMLMVK